MERRIQEIRQAIPAIRDRAVIEARSTVVKVSVRMMRTLLEGIAAFDEKIEEAAAAHPDFFIFDSLPGAGAVMAPRLSSAALGSQRERYGSARSADLQRDWAGDREKREKEMGAFPPLSSFLPQMPELPRIARHNAAPGALRK